MAMGQTSRDIICERAREYGWKSTISDFPLQDRYIKDRKTLVLRFDIIGRCIPGGELIETAQHGPGKSGTWVDNRNKAMKVLEGR